MDFFLLKKIAKEKRTSIISWRRLLHQHPEIGLDLPFTKKLVTTELDKMGLGRVYGLMDAGIVVDLLGKSSDCSSFVALRVDMDALPLYEKTGLPYLDPQFPLGSVGLRSGQINAYTDEFSLFIKGKSAHGASPHLSVDPVVATSFAIQALQTIVSRNIPPLEAAVVSIGEIKGGDVSNIIPDQVRLRGTIRSLSSKIRDLIFSRIKSIAKGLEESFGIEAELSFISGSPPVICDEDLTKTCLLILKKALDEESVVNIPYPLLGGDDFAFFAQKVPATLIRLGCGKESFTFPLHSSKFNFDEEVLQFGVALFSYLLVRLTSQNSGRRNNV